MRVEDFMGMSEKRMNDQLLSAALLLKDYCKTQDGCGMCPFIKVKENIPVCSIADFGHPCDWEVTK